MSYQQNRRKKPKLCGTKKPFQKKAAYGPDRFLEGSKTVEQKRLEMENKIIETFQLRPAGPWSKDVLNNEGLGKLLNAQHMVEVKKILLKIKPKNKGDIEKALKLAENTPQQRFIILNEASMQGPLTSEAFQEYMSLFKQILPNHWKQIYGKKTPTQITIACIKQMPELEIQRAKKK